VLPVGDLAGPPGGSPLSEQASAKARILVKTSFSFGGHSESCVRSVIVSLRSPIECACSISSLKWSRARDVSHCSP
jgi:hypothetical protein